MPSLDSLVVDLSVNTAALKKGLDDAKGHIDSFGKKLEHIFDAVAGLEAVKLSMEGIAKAGELMERGIADATSLGNGPARELGETLEKVGLATRQLGADLASNLAPAFNSLIEFFTGGVNWGKLLAKIADVIGQAFRDMVRPIVAAAGAIKGFLDGGTLASTLGGAIKAMDKLAEKGESFAGSLKTATELAATIASMQMKTADDHIEHQAGRMLNQYTELTGNRRNDKFAGATAGFDDFVDALNKYVTYAEAAANATRKAAVAQSLHQEIQAEVLRSQAANFTEGSEAAQRAADAFRNMKEKLIVDTQAINNIHFGLSESIKNVGLNAGIRTQQFNNTFNPTQGFENFADALERQTKALDNQAGLMAAAAVIEQQYGAAAQGTVLALKAQADAEGRTAEAAKGAADAFFAVKDKLRDQLIGALQVAGETFLSKIGQLGTTINDAIKGFQQGGIWGALAALIMDLLSMMDGWKKIQNIAQGQLMTALQEMASGLNGVIDGLRPLMGAIGSITHALHGVLNPVLLLVGKILEGIAPIFESIGVTMQVMGPILDVICRILGAVLTPIFKALEPILRLVAESFLGTELGIQYVILAFDMLVDWVDKLVGGSNQDQINKDWVSIAQTQAQMIDLWNNGLDGMANKSADAAEATGAQTDQVNKSTGSLSKFNQQLTNLPNGFKYLEDRFNAMQALGSGAGLPSSSWGSAAGSTSRGGTSTGSGPSGYANGFLGYGGGGAGTTVHVHVSGSVVVEKDLISSIKKALDVDHFQQHGVPRP